MAISEDALRFLASYKAEMAAWRMELRGGTWIAHDSWRGRDDKVQPKLGFTHVLRNAHRQERFMTEADAIQFVQLTCIDKALADNRANHA